jgi:hypothetical protein
MTDYKATIDWTYKPQLMNFLDACRFTASVIPKDRPWYLSYSGGADSEFVLRFLYAEKYPVIPVILVTDMNRREALRGIQTCEELGITPTILRMTNENFMKKYWTEIAEKLNGVGPFAVPGLVVAEYVQTQGGLTITGTHLQDEFLNTGNGVGELDTFEYDAYNTALLPDSTVNFLDYTIEVVYAMAKGVPEQDFSLYKCEFYGLNKFRKNFYKAPKELIAMAYLKEQQVKGLGKRSILMTKADFVQKVEELANK